MCQLLIKHMKQLASKLCSKSLQLCYFRFFLWWVQANAQCISQGGHEDHSQKAFPNKTFVVGWEKLSAESFFSEVSYFTTPSLTRDDGFCIRQLFTTPFGVQQSWILSATPSSSLEYTTNSSGTSGGSKPLLWFPWLTLYISQHQLSTITHCFQACQGFQSCRLQHTYALAAG